MSFDPALPTTRDLLRFHLADYINATLKRDVEIVDDDTYDALITLYGARQAGARIADTISLYYGTKWQQGDQSEDPLKTSEAYSKLAERFRSDPAFNIDSDEPLVGPFEVGELTTPDMTGYL